MSSRWFFYLKFKKLYHSVWENINSFLGTMCNHCSFVPYFTWGKSLAYCFSCSSVVTIGNCYSVDDWISRNRKICVWDLQDFLPNWGEYLTKAPTEPKVLIQNSLIRLQLPNTLWKIWISRRRWNIMEIQLNSFFFSPCHVKQLRRTEVVLCRGCVG